MTRDYQAIWLNNIFSDIFLQIFSNIQKNGQKYISKRNFQIYLYKQIWVCLYIFSLNIFKVLKIYLKTKCILSLECILKYILVFERLNKKYFLFQKNIYFLNPCYIYKSILASLCNMEIDSAPKHPL